MIDARSHRTFAPVWLLLLALLLLLLLLAGLGAMWLLKRQIVGLDSAFNEFLGPWRQAPVLDVFLWLTVLGSAPAVSVAAVTATGFLGAARECRTIAALWGAFAGSAATTWTIKYLVGRARPEFIDGAAAVSPSFPSAHSSSALAVYGFLAVVVARKLLRRRTRIAVLAASAIAIASIGFSRLFLSVHYLTDVLAGFAIGAIWMLAACAVMRRDEPVEGARRPVTKA